MRQTFRALVIGAAIAALAAGGAAFAAGEGDRATAESILQQLERDETAKSVAADSIAKARSALERATRLRATGDEAHAKLADGLARDHAESARDRVRAAELERRSVEARAHARDAGAQEERERTQLEEALARTGRLRAALEEAEREAKDTQRTATGVNDAGVPRPKPPAAPKGGKGDGKRPGRGGGR